MILKINLATMSCTTETQSKIISIMVSKRFEDYTFRFNNTNNNIQRFLLLSVSMSSIFITGFYSANNIVIVDPL